VSGRARFAAALAGGAVAWAPLVWERLPELALQPAADWWRDATVARRLLLDVAAVADADALFVVAVPGVRGGGDEALDALASGSDAGAVCSLLERLAASAPFATIALVPDADVLARDFGAEDVECAEDALADLVRAVLEAGADAVALSGDAAAASADRVAGIASYYGRPVLVLDAAPRFAAGSDAPVVVVGDDGAAPAGFSAGLAVTAGDVSARWDAAALRRAGEGLR